MEWKKCLSFLLAGLLLLIPTKVLAVDFEISKVDIEARLNEDGTAEVTERHTYDFDGDFNGVTRELHPKQGASIDEFKAFENGKRLKVERDENFYKIYRSGDDETITVELQYQIEGGVEKFQDGAEFYWPFFDERNESDYGEMAITIFPPAPASDVTFLGYDAAYDTASLLEGGTVSFNMGDVSAGENGDIRVVFEPELFPALSGKNGTIRPIIETEKLRLAEQQAAFQENQQSVSRLGSLAIAAIGAILAWLFGGAWFQSRQNKRAAVKDNEKDFFVPEEKMSLPATIYFTKSSMLSSNAIAAALMDLVRKGNTKQIAEDKFELVDRQTPFTHEEILMELLFDQVGQSSSFETADVVAYTKKEATAEAYREAIASWNSEVAKEVKQQTLYSKKKGVRWFAALLAALTIVLTVFFGIYELFPLMTLALLFVLTSFSFAVFYKPLTAEGRKMREEWKQLEKTMKDLPEDTWHQLSKDEKLRAYLYLLGVESHSTDKKAQSFARAETFMHRSDSESFTLNPILLAAVFVSADTNSTAHASSSSSASFGGGAGGGGGGSGAF
ncbi:DUF2207 domain-containing protein [Planococcus sp. N028]|uniref:DUF2207 domain-containing protein n=1 Tax=Planococcus shixiaomingii TaxID=3058393 RepID=A0ABT8MYY5_9BACL|nr:DUF2207 domain-containing protein [Planococcus sp. N028]MDN7240857.1 DUF2207 domain-containing protein [Planococcus sp. N028]